MRLSLLLNNSSKHVRIAKILIGIVPVLLLVWIANKNFAFTGTYQIGVKSFLHLPSNIRYVGGHELGVVSTPDGERTRPYTDLLKFAVTLPRGFDTMTVKAQIEAEPFSRVALGANTHVLSTGQPGIFRIPYKPDARWRTISLRNATLYVKEHSEVQSVDDFWRMFQSLPSIYSVGDSLVEAIPYTLYAGSANVHNIKIPGAYRDTLSLRSYLDGNSQTISLDVKAPYGSGKNGALRFTLLHEGIVLLNKSFVKISNVTQHITVETPNIEPGFYTLQFIPSSESVVFSGIELRGDAVELDSTLFLDQSNVPVSLYTTCNDFNVEAVHQLGMENSIRVNEKPVKIAKVKQAQKVHTNAGVNHVTFPRADVSISNSCGFLIQPPSTLYLAHEKLARRISVVQDFDATLFQAADIIFDPIPSADLLKGKGDVYVIEKTFDLHTLAAQGKTFTFSLEKPGLTTHEGSYLHLKNLTFTASRPPFSLSDILKVFKSLF